MEIFERGTIAFLTYCEMPSKRGTLFMKNNFIGHTKWLTLFLLTLNLNVSAASIQASDQSFVRLPGNALDIVIPKSANLGNVDEDKQVPMTFVLPLRNQESLERLIKRIHDPADIKYGKYLTTEEFNKKFAPSQEDYNKAIAYAKSQ